MFTLDKKENVMKIPKKEDIKNFVISAQKGLMEIPVEVEQIKTEIHKVGVTLGKAASWLADKAEYCKATDIICKKLDITRDMQDFLIVSNNTSNRKVMREKGRYSFDGVIMPFPKELAEDAFSQVILECLNSRNYSPSPKPQIVSSRISGLQKHLKHLKFEGEYRLADSWEDLFVKLDENWAKFAAYEGKKDPREQTVERNPNSVFGLPSKLYVVALMQEKLQKIENEKARRLGSYNYDMEHGRKMSSNKYGILNDRIVYLDRQAQKYRHLLEKAQVAEATMSQIHNVSLEKNAQNFDRVAQRHKEREVYENAVKQADEAYKQSVKAESFFIRATELGEEKLNKKKEEIEKQQARELEEFKKKQEMEREEQIKDYNDKIRTTLVGPREQKYNEAKKKTKEANKKENEEREIFFENGKDLL